MHQPYVKGRRPLRAQVLEPTGVAICLGVLAASSSVCRLRRSSYRAYSTGFRSWARFSGVDRGGMRILTPRLPDADKIQELLEFVAWCASEGNQAGTIAE